MSNGSYDRRAPSAASQIITLERLLAESEARNEELEAEQQELVYDCRDARIAKEKAEAENAQSRDHIIEQERGICGRERRIAELKAENAKLRKAIAQMNPNNPFSVAAVMAEVEGKSGG